MADTVKKHRNLPISDNIEAYEDENNILRANDAGETRRPVPYDRLIKGDISSRQAVDNPDYQSANDLSIENYNQTRPAGKGYASRVMSQSGDTKSASYRSLKKFGDRQSNDCSSRNSG